LVKVLENFLKNKEEFSKTAAQHIRAVAGSPRRFFLSIQIYILFCRKNIYFFYNHTTFLVLEFFILSKAVFCTTIYCINKVFDYPRATSSIIIITKPKTVPIVAISEFPFCWDSGINSSTTTKIIAPAAKARA